jgi:hypothetical protein
LSALPGQDGLTAEKATMKDCWRLIDKDGNRIKHPTTGSTAPECAANLQLTHRLPSLSTNRISPIVERSSATS